MIATSCARLEYHVSLMAGPGKSSSNDCCVLLDTTFQQAHVKFAGRSPAPTQIRPRASVTAGGT